MGASTHNSMSSNNQIRVVKRAQREQQAEELEAKATDTTQAKARDAALTVTGWIVEQQEEQSGGGARADFEKLFEEPG